MAHSHFSLLSSLMPFRIPLIPASKPCEMRKPKTMVCSSMSNQRSFIHLCTHLAKVMCLSAQKLFNASHSYQNKSRHPGWSCFRAFHYMPSDHICSVSPQCSPAVPHTPGPQPRPTLGSSQCFSTAGLPEIPSQFEKELTTRCCIRIIDPMILDSILFT